jgi:hypothetical protein
MDRTLVSALAALVLGGALSACGGGDGDGAAAEQDGVPAAETTAVAAEPALRTDYDNIPGMAMGSPPETAQMNCSDETTCTAVFIAPTDAVVKPFGLAAKLLKADAEQVRISLDGTEQTVAVGKASTVRGVAVSVVGTPGTIVTLVFEKKN